MATKKKVIKEKKQKKVKQKQSQSQSQKVIINLNEVKNKPKRTRRKSTNKNIKFNEISKTAMPAGWVKYGAQDDREANTLRGNLNEVQNKLLSIKNVENPVNNDERNERIAKIEEGMKIMRIGGNNAFRDLYSKFDQIGDFTNKTKFKSPVKEEEKKQSQPIYPIKKKDNEPIFIPNDEKQAPPFIINQSNYLENSNNFKTPQKTRGRPKLNLTEEELKKKKSEENRKYRLGQKTKAEEKMKVVKEQFLMRANDININGLGISPKKNTKLADLSLEDRRKIMFKSYYENLDKAKKEEEEKQFKKKTRGRPVGSKNKKTIVINENNTFIPEANSTFNSTTNNKQEPFDLEKYRNNNKKLKEEADEKYDYMTKFVAELKDTTGEKIFI